MASTPQKKKDVTPPEEPLPLRRVAVIDVGSSSIRMAIGELDSQGGVRTLDEVQQAVDLGKDSFTHGSIYKSTIESCVDVITSFKNKLREYGLTEASQVRAVATSAVREASNREAFIDRILISTGILIEPISEADVSRITYLSVEPLLRADKVLGLENTLIIEVGGGSTEMLFLQGGHVAVSHSYRMGSLRMREMLETFRAPVAREQEILENTINRSLDQIASIVPSKQAPSLVALGGDVRLAARELIKNWDESPRLRSLRLSALRKFTDHILGLSVEDIVRHYHVSFPEAESVGPALLALLRLAERLKIKVLHVAPINFRDSLLFETALGGAWDGNFRELILRSALDLGRKYHFDEPHAIHVANTAVDLFDGMRKEHGLDDRYRLILQLAGLLHEIGMFVGMPSHHKHTLYLIRHSEIFGLNQEDKMVVALVARHHRRGIPKASSSTYTGLSREKRITIMKLSALLRIADALDRTRSQRIRKIDIKPERKQILIEIKRAADLSFEQIALQEKGSLFADVYGKPVVLRKG